MKYAIIDIGELGWSLYQSGHALWLKRQGHSVIAFTYKDRMALYKNRVDEVKPVPQSFITQFGAYSQDGAGLRGIKGYSIWSLFKALLPAGYQIDYGLDCDWELPKRAIYEPYEVDDEFFTKPRILVFPRCRKEEGFDFRNLSEEFYLKLCKSLCEIHPDKFITAIGSIKGAYGLKNIQASNFDNWIGATQDLQALINVCSSSIASIGGTSAPPKIALLQGVPTFIIGHEKQRFTIDENWSKTRVGFYEIEKENYQNFNIDDCINKIKEFINAD